MNRRVKVALTCVLVCILGATVLCNGEKLEAKTSRISTVSYQKSMIGKLGTSHGRMDCSHYVNWAQKNMSRLMQSKTAGAGKIKDIHIAYKPSSSWRQKSITVKYRQSVLNSATGKWNWKASLNSVNIAKKATSWSRKSGKKQSKFRENLDVGDVLVYNYPSHVALYFGYFNNAADVAKYLVKTLGYNGGKALKRVNSRGLTAYKNAKGKIIIKEYKNVKCQKYWRIHSSNSLGVMIDNDITFSSMGGGLSMAVNCAI